MTGLILTCDDEIHINKLVELTLRKDNYQVVSCTSGEAAWQFIQNQVPDLLICDCSMPGLPGLELCRRIRLDEQASHLPIMLLTARGFQFSEEKLERDLHLNGIIHKPFSPHELRFRVAEVLAQQAAHS